MALQITKNNRKEIVEHGVEACMLKSPSNEKELFNHQYHTPQKSTNRAYNVAHNDTESTQNRKHQPESVKPTFEQSFELGVLIGKGAYAPVHHAIHIQTGKPVAVKIYKEFRNLEKDRRGLITREVHIMKRLHHENIVKYGGIYNEPEALYIVMQHLGGGSLFQLVRSYPHGKLPESEARPLYTGILKGVAYMHSQHIVHRDLKLENVLLDDKGRVRIIDFGFASILKPGVPCRMACGTPSYMPPEILKKEEYDGTKADMWSMGVILYAMLHGAFPFKAQQPNDLYAKILAGEFATSAALSPEAKDLVQELLVIDPKNRLTAEEALIHPWLNPPVNDTFPKASTSPKAARNLLFSNDKVNHDLLTPVEAYNNTNCSPSPIITRYLNCDAKLILSQSSQDGRSCLKGPTKHEASNQDEIFTRLAIQDQHIQNHNNAIISEKEANNGRFFNKIKYVLWAISRKSKDQLNSTNRMISAAPADEDSYP